MLRHLGESKHLMAVSGVGEDEGWLAANISRRQLRKFTSRLLLRRTVLA